MTCIRTDPLEMPDGTVITNIAISARDTSRVWFRITDDAGLCVPCWMHRAEFARFRVYIENGGDPETWHEYKPDSITSATEGEAIRMRPVSVQPTERGIDVDAEGEAVGRFKVTDADSTIAEAVDAPDMYR